MNDPAASRPDLAQWFGALDIYLFDQLLRGRIPPDARIFDAGCGSGRNLDYFLRAGHPVEGVDSDPGAVAAAQERALRCGRGDAVFRVARLEELNAESGPAEVVICNAVLHFASDHGAFERMLRGAWSVLAPGGLFFARLASNIGLEREVEPLGKGRHRLPDGTERYLVTADRLREEERSLGAEVLDPLKTTVVGRLRSMTTWVLRKP